MPHDRDFSDSHIPNVNMAGLQAEYMALLNEEREVASNIGKFANALDNNQKFGNINNYAAGLEKKSAPAHFEWTGNAYNSSQTALRSINLLGELGADGIRTTAKDVHLKILGLQGIRTQLE